MPLLPPPASSSRESIASPVQTQLPNLSATQIAALPYPPDFFPGARDVKTSFGSMRVYEWGNETGRKVMLIHGDATPTPLWKGVASRLIEKGCRLIVFDLWGRGYSDTPTVAHEGRLYSLQLLFAASSSPLPWCTETFSIVGFSLGGAITMDFVMSFPHLVHSVALLAPAGLLRVLPGVYQDLKQAAADGKDEKELREKLAKVLDVDEEEPEAEHKDNGIVDADAIVRWQYQQHKGHAASFVSTLHYGPVQGQHEVWRKACQVLKEKQTERGGREKLLAICGSEDFVVPAAHLTEDLDSMIGQGEYVFKTVKGGHGFLMDDEACVKVVEALEEEWKI